jgi:uncharacterized membrane protein YdjX (TVP38/TMEM64 family)
MKKSKNVKIILALFYVIALSLLLYFLFSKFSYEDFSSIKIIQLNVEKLNELKDNNLILLSLIFCILTVIWVFLLGFGTPVALIGGFIFGKWFGTLLITFSLSIGALCLYLIAKYFFYDFLKEKFLIKFKYLEKVFYNKQLVIMIIFRFVGLVPFFLANLLPVIFNIGIRNYFFGTLVGILPSIFIMSSLGSGISSAIYQFETFPTFFSLLILPEIYMPILGFFIIILISFFLKKKLR